VDPAWPCDLLVIADDERDFERIHEYALNAIAARLRVRSAPHAAQVTRPAHLHLQPISSVRIPSRNPARLEPWPIKKWDQDCRASFCGVEGTFRSVHAAGDASLIALETFL